MLMAARSSQAFDCCCRAMRGWSLLYRNLQQPAKEKNEKARSLFEQALTSDPNNSEALAGDATSYFAEYIFGWGKSGAIALVIMAVAGQCILVVERGRQQGPCPARITLRRRLIQQRQDALVRRGRVLRLSAPLARFVETRKPLLGSVRIPLNCKEGQASGAL